MSNYNFNGTGYVDLQNPTPDLNTILNYQNEISPNREISIIKDPIELSQELTTRVQPKLQRKIKQVNKQFFTPSKDGIVINNHDRLYDYYKVGNNLYYKKKGDEGWIDISNNQLAQQRINNTLAKNKINCGKHKNSFSKNVEDNKTYDAGTLNDVVVTNTKYNIPSSLERIQGSTDYKLDAINNIVRNTIYGKRPQFVPLKVKSSTNNGKNIKPQDKRLKEPKSRPYSYIGGYKYYIYTDGKGNWIK